MSGAKQGPDLFFAGGECLDRFGVWVRRTDVDLEEATGDEHTRATEATALGRDSILRDWEADTPRAEWLNEKDLDPTRNELSTTNFELWGAFNGATIRILVNDGVEVTDTGAGGASISQVESTDIIDTTFTASARLKKTKGAPTVNMRLTWNGNFGVIVNPETGAFIAEGSPDAVSVVEDGTDWIISVTETNFSSVVAIDLFPAWGEPGTLSVSQDIAATGSNRFRQVQLEVGTERTGYQSMPRDLDRKFPTLLLERDATNSWTFSEDLTNSVYAKNDTTINPNALLSPASTLTMDKIEDTVAVATTHGVNRLSPTLIAGNDQALSFYLAGGEYDRILVTVQGAGSQVSFDIDLGEQTVVAAEGGVSIVRYARLVQVAESLGVGQRFRFECAFFLDATTTSATTFFEMNNATSTIYDGVLGRGLFMWGFQWEASRNQVTQYMATGGVVTNQAADIFSGAYPHAPVVQTVYVKFVESGSISIPAVRVFAIINSASANPNLIIDVSSAAYRGVYFDIGGSGSVSQIPSGAGSVPEIGDVVELNLHFRDGGTRVQMEQRLNNGEGVFGPIGQAAAVSSEWSQPPRLFINSGNGSSFVGLQRLLALKAHRGVRTLDFMRAL